jgi:hypothetical protein
MNHETVIQDMLGSRVRNYIIPGLNSYLLDKGKVRMFESTREYSGTVTPHSHRFDFGCYVLHGEVVNRVYSPVSPFGEGGPFDDFDKPLSTKLDGDSFTVRTLMPSDTIDDMKAEFGGYDRVTEDFTANYTSENNRYKTGDWYSMTHREVHSIQFARDTRVIFFEGPEMTKHNIVLLPYMHNETLETMECDKPWMYLRD